MRAQSTWRPIYLLVILIIAAILFVIAKGMFRAAEKKILSTPVFTPGQVK